METKDILKSLRKNKGYSTMQEFCSAASINFSTYQNYETGKRLPTAEILMKIADFYGVTTDYLLGREQLNEQSDPLKVLSRQQNMDEIEEIFLQKYLAMPQEGRDAVIEMMHSVIETFRRSDVQQTITVKTAARAAPGEEHKPPGAEQLTPEEIAELFNGEDNHSV